MNKLIRPLALCLASALLLSFCGCGVSKEEILNVIAPTEAPQAEEAVRPVTQETETPPLVETCAELTGLFSPFWAEADGDKLVVAATQLALGEDAVTLDTVTNDDGSVTVSLELQSGLRFSDGAALDADDLIFTLYALLDESYNGPSELNTLPIRGLTEYYTGVPMALYEKYGALYDEIYNDGDYDGALQRALQEAKDAVPHNLWNQTEAQKALDAYDQEKAEEIRAAIEQSWRDDARDIVNFCLENFGSTVEYHTGYTLEQVKQSEGLQVMFAMVEWSLATLTPDGVLVNKRTGDLWDLENSFPTLDDFYQELYESYSGDPVKYWQIEGIGRKSMFERARKRVIAAWAAEDEDWSGSVKRISGIERAGDRRVEITLDSFNGAAASILSAVYIAPLHWYGDETLYDYAGGYFGFIPGSMSALHEHDAEPLGAGAYILTDYDGGTAYLEANAEYYSAAPENPKLEITTG